MYADTETHGMPKAEALQEARGWRMEVRENSRKPILTFALRRGGILPPVIPRSPGTAWGTPPVTS